MHCIREINLGTFYRHHMLNYNTSTFMFLILIDLIFCFSFSSSSYFLSNVVGFHYVDLFFKEGNLVTEFNLSHILLKYPSIRQCIYIMRYWWKDLMELISLLNIYTVQIWQNDKVKTTVLLIRIQPAKVNKSRGLTIMCSD